MTAISTQRKPARDDGRRLEMGLVAIVENGKEIVSYNDAVIFIKDPIDDDAETEITITTTNFSAIAIAKKIVDRFNGE